MLRKLNLLPVYDSSESDLVSDLLVPSLRNSNSYLRGVGFFTSGWLRLAAHGLAGLIENGGSAKFVISPILEKSDWDALQLGEDAKSDEALKGMLENNVDDIASSLESTTLNTLAWMIADGVLEFKFAVARDCATTGDYHDKVGVFTDSHGDSVAIHGSFNDTIKGSLNGEAFSVFKSWDNGQLPFVEKHNKRLLELWQFGNRQFKTFNIPEAVQRKFMKLRSTRNRPYSLKATDPFILETNISKLYCPLKLYSYQEDAINEWVSANCHGILEMATGTGKTVTSLMAAINRYETIGRLALVILVPYIHLLEQWEQNCKKFGFNPVLCSSAHGNWHIEVKSKIQDFNLQTIDHICILAVHASASKEKFAKATKNLKEECTMIIGDEVHGFGTSTLRQAMISNTGMRLGLSATPKRWFDDEGTELIFSFFGEICYEFPLECAIGKYLTPYEYRPVLVNFSHAEMDLYEELTNRISKLSSMTNENISDLEEKIKILLLERALLVATAEEKIGRLLQILREMLQNRNESEISHILVYCAPGSHKNVLLAIANLGLKCHEFVHSVSLKNRQKILEQFDNGDIQVLIAIKCLDEGVDLPSTKTAFFLASTSNPREFVQRRGRILRLAEGKNKAIVYDFIVVPRTELVPLKRDIDASLLRREMPRFAEFASAASNEFDARSKLWDLVNNYEMLNLFDEKPWDMYQRLIKDKSTYNF
jgi:superfamily II DNA or RNA helicase